MTAPTTVCNLESINSTQALCLPNHFPCVPPIFGGTIGTTLVSGKGFVTRVSVMVDARPSFLTASRLFCQQTLFLTIEFALSLRTKMQFPPLE